MIAKKIITEINMYKNVQYELVKWQREGAKEYIYNYYIYIPDDKIQEKYRSIFSLSEAIVDYSTFSTYNYDVLDNIVKMHGGITYMAIVKNPHKYYHIGCDYNHSFDTNKVITFEILRKDAMNSIDELYNMFVIV